MYSARQAKDQSVKNFEKTEEYKMLSSCIKDATERGMFSISLKPDSYNSGSVVYLRSRGYTVVKHDDYLDVSW